MHIQDHMFMYIFGESLMPWHEGGGEGAVEVGRKKVTSLHVIVMLLLSI